MRRKKPERIMMFSNSSIFSIFITTGGGLVFPLFLRQCTTGLLFFCKSDMQRGHRGSYSFLQSPAPSQLKKKKAKSSMLTAGNSVLAAFRAYLYADSTTFCMSRVKKKNKSSMFTAGNSAFL